MAVIPAPTQFAVRHASIAFLDFFHGDAPWHLVAIRDKVIHAVTYTQASRRAVAAEEWLTRHNREGFNVYFGPNPLRAALTKKAAKSDIASAQWLWADVDPPETLTPTDLDAWRSERLVQLDDLLISGTIPEPTYLIDSGRGLWAFWRLTTPQPVDSIKVKVNGEDSIKDGPATLKIEAHARAIARLFGADHCSDICRIARLPGTTNFKTGRVASILTMDEATYSLDDFPEPIFAPVVAPAPVEDATSTSTGEADELDAGLGERIATDDVPVGERSEHFYGVVASLTELGWSPERIERAISGRDWSFGKYKQRLRGEIERAALKARGRVATPAVADHASKSPAAAQSKRADPLDAITLGRNTDWARPAGLLAMIADWIMATSRRPNRPLAVAAATSVISALCGRHLYAPTGTALNLYVICLAGTAVGKDRPLSAIEQILRAADLPHIHANGDVFSVSALEQIVIDHPCCVLTVDEIGDAFLKPILSKKANVNEARIKAALLKLWAWDIYKEIYRTIGRAKEKAVDIFTPSISIFGASTPQAFFDALTAGNINDGLMNRLLLANGGPRPHDEEPKLNVAVIPDDIKRSLRGILPRLTGDLGQVIDPFGPASAAPKRCIPWASPEMEIIKSDFSNSIDREMNADPDREDLMGRIFEYSIRLASIHAVSRAVSQERMDPSTGEFTFTAADASVNKDDLEWGAAWAVDSARVLIDKSESMMAPNEYGNDKNRIKAAIRKAGTISRSDLLKKVQHVKAYELNGMLDQLHEARFIEPVGIGDEPKKGAGRPPKSYRWIGP